MLSIIYSAYSECHIVIGIFGNSYSSLVHLIGSDLNLTCSTTSTPVVNSVFRWRCSTGYLAGVEMGQTISVTLQESGVIVCAYAVDGIEYASDPIEFNVTGKSSDHWYCCL